jgi:DNA polymerase-3 subunit delta'
MKASKVEEVTKPKSQLNLYGYESYFKFFNKLYEQDNLPNSILISGQKGLGKSTFTYHFINFLLSKGEKNEYNRRDYLIDPNNSTYKSIQSGTHANLFILDAIDDENIKIDQIRKLLLFLNKSTYYKSVKIVLLDNAEYLNINSSNALLKAIEEPSKDTYFFIINNDSQKIMNTIKSRCIDFVINFNFLKKKNIFNKIAQTYSLNFTESDLDIFLYFDTHGNLLKYLSTLKNSDFKISKDYLSCISYFMDLYNEKTDPKLLGFITLSIQNFYNQLSLNNSLFINNYYRNLYKILHLIDNMKKFHLDKKNLIFSIDKIIKNER